MVDFKAQIQNGLKAHEQANADKAEINAIFKDLSRQLSEVTSDKVIISIREDSDILSKIQSFGRSITPDAKKYGIYVQNSQYKQSPVYRIAGWEPSRTGYPCNVIFNGEKFECYDKKSLEEVLGSLLSTSETGRMIVRSMEFLPVAEPDKNESGI